MVRLAYDGFLQDPEQYQSSVVDGNKLVTLEQLISSPVLILLGEPGLGKSQTLADTRSNIANRIEAEGNRTLYLDLSRYGDESRLDKDLFSSSLLTDWQTNNYRLYIFLDSFDECLLKVDTLVHLFSTEFSRHQEQSGRLHLWIACRTAVWPSSLTESLKNVWGEKQVATYSLAPLRRKDVCEAAAVNNIHPSDFLEEVIGKGVTSLAIKPITLEFLIGVYKKQGNKLLGNQKLNELYLEGCRALCVEMKDKNRHRQRSISRLSVEQRVVVAARIAAMMVFSNRPSIWVGEPYESSEDDLLLRDICEGYEIVQGRRFEVRREVVWEVLNTGLFSSADLDRMAWAHRTYSEFLSAWYLKLRKVDKQKILNLIVHLGEGGGRIIPQLHETTSWIASMDSEVFLEVLSTDPDVLLRSDLLNDQDNSTKELFVKTMLELCGRGNLCYSYRYKAYESLNYSRLSSQLSPYIEDKNKNIYARYLALDIAADCRLEVVHPLLLKVALDSEQPYVVRYRAVRILADDGSSKIQVKLKPLALGTEEDSQDYIRGYALQAVYPKHMTTQEFLACLTRPRDNIIGGAYQDFIAEEVAQRIPGNDLVIAIRWLKDLPSYRDLNYPFNYLSDRLLIRAWESLDNASVLKEFAEVAAQRLQQYDQVIDGYGDTSFAQLLQEDAEKRRRLLGAVVSEIADTKHGSYYVSGHSGCSVLHPLDEDFEWLVHQSRVAKSDQEREIYASLVRRRIDWEDTYKLEVILKNVDSSPALKKEFSWYLGSIDLDSAEAEEKRTRYNEEQQRSDSHMHRLSDPLLKERVLSCLERFEQGDMNAWWHLYQLLLMLPGSERYSERWKVDMTDFPGWKNANESTKDRIVAAAKKYIYEGDPDTSVWLGKRAVNYPAIGGYRALRLIAMIDRSFISQLPAAIWQKWAGIILFYPNVNNDPDKEIRRFILEEAYAKAPQEFIRVLDIVIDSENDCDSHIQSHIETTEYIWDEQLEGFLLNKVKDNRLTESNFGYILQTLLTHEIELARKIAKSYLSIHALRSQNSHEKAIASAKKLLLYTDDAAWSVVWRVIQHDTDVGKAILEAVATHTAYDGQVDSKLTADDVANLYVFLHKNYPNVSTHQDESNEKALNGPEARLIAPMDNIRTWQGYLPQRLQERGTQEACSALRKIIDMIPEQKDAIQWRLAEAEILARRQSWEPPSSMEVLRSISKEEPSISELSKQVDETREDLKRKMSEEPKISINNSKNVAFNTGKDGIVNQRVGTEKDGSSNRLARIGIAVTIIMSLLGVAFSGILNEPLKRVLPGTGSSSEQVGNGDGNKSVEME